MTVFRNSILFLQSVSSDAQHGQLPTCHQYPGLKIAIQVPDMLHLLQFMDMSSLQEALPNPDLSTFLDGLPETWFSSSSCAYVPSASHGMLSWTAYINDHLSNVHTKATGYDTMTVTTCACFRWTTVPCRAGPELSAAVNHSIILPASM